MCKDAAEADPALAAGYNWSVLVLVAMPFLLAALGGVQALRALSPDRREAVTRQAWQFARRRGWIVLAAGLPALAAVTMLVTPPDAQAVRAPPAAALAGMRDLRNGRPIAAADLQNRVTVVTFFATWCQPCREQVAELAALQRAFSPEAVAVVAVNAFEDYQLPHTHADGSIHYHRPSSVGGDLPLFAGEFGPGLTFLFNTPAVSTAFGGVTRIPTTLVFAPDGRLVARYVNEAAGDFLKPTPETLRRDIERAQACDQVTRYLRGACLWLAD
jgi:thiol-disulfide isomerase/thioredoxin